MIRINYKLLKKKITIEVLKKLNLKMSIMIKNHIMKNRIINKVLKVIIIIIIPSRVVTLLKSNIKWSIIVLLYKNI